MVRPQYGDVVHLSRNRTLRPPSCFRWGRSGPEHFDGSSERHSARTIMCRFDHSPEEQERRVKIDGSSDMQLWVDASSRNRSWIVNRIACIIQLRRVLIAWSIW